jgi:hypothetical protein
MFCLGIGGLSLAVGPRAALPAVASARVFWAEAHVPNMISDDLALRMRSP